MKARVIRIRTIYARTESTISLAEPKNLSFQSDDSVTCDFILRKTANDN